MPKGIPSGLTKREWYRQYYEKHKEVIKARSKARYKAKRKELNAQSKARYMENRPYNLVMKRRWRENNLVMPGRKNWGLNGERGTASELFVESELLRLGLLVGKPSNRVAKHDLFVKASDRWWTVQVKTAQVRLTGAIKLRTRLGIVSDLIAAVDLEGHRILWLPNTPEPVPPELL